ncbi:DMT family transporter [Paracoccus sp. TK19116]|uniref:DMT family transporter n=1 Tax=Paracoccus albicereus TaxID=2922394 RepID=A0ABT1MVY8_9RHOB|nr:DMT family transporter [Paracoccus albicereus]MCQ0971661.1 DMT family transporter [Paracoccus albicereus]
MSVLLALFASLAYGVGDFIGGLASRRGSAFAVALWASIGGGIAMCLAAVVVGGRADPVDLGWGVLAGIGNGMGGTFLYRGLAAGRMGVVAPLSSLTGALLPIVAGLALGERPSALSWCGILLALPAVGLISREPAAPGNGGGGRLGAGVVDGLLAGLGFGLLFIATGQIAPSAGLWPLVALQMASIVVIPFLASLLRQAWWPTRRAEAIGLIGGILAAAAVLGFMLAAQRGLLSIVAVLTALYPAATIALAAIILNERLRPIQGLGLILAGGAVVLIALG